MRILFSNNGAPRMMSRMMRNFSTGSASGSVKSIAVRNIIDDFDLFNRKITKFSPVFPNSWNDFPRCPCRTDRLFCMQFARGRETVSHQTNKNYERRTDDLHALRAEFRGQHQRTGRSGWRITPVSDRMRKEREVEEAPSPRTRSRSADPLRRRTTAEFTRLHRVNSAFLRLCGMGIYT